MVFFVVFSVIMLLTVWAFKISIFLTKISDISQTTVGFSHSKILSFGPYPVHSGPYKLSHVTLDRWIYSTTILVHSYELFVGLFRWNVTINDDIWAYMIARLSCCNVSDLHTLLRRSGAFLLRLLAAGLSCAHSARYIPWSLMGLQRAPTTL